MVIHHVSSFLGSPQRTLESDVSRGGHVAPLLRGVILMLTWTCLYCRGTNAHTLPDRSHHYINLHDTPGVCSFIKHINTQPPAPPCFLSIMSIDNNTVYIKLAKLFWRYFIYLGWLNILLFLDVWEVKAREREGVYSYIESSCDVRLPATIIPY